MEDRLGYTCTVSVVEFRFLVLGLLLGVFAIGGYVCRFSIRKPLLEFYGWPIFGFRFRKFVFRINECMKSWDLTIGLQHWWPEFNCSSDRILIYNFRSNSDMWTCLKNNEGETESIAKWRGWGGRSLPEKNEEISTWNFIIESIKNKVWMYGKVNQVL